MALNLRDRVVATTHGLFSHGPQPLVDTLDHMGDPGLLGPDSVSWAVIGDSAAFVGGIRALLMQTAHPEVVAGVDQHSTYRSDPLGRLTRTSLYVTQTTYGASPEVDEAVAMVRRAHAPVKGQSERSRCYRASDPGLAAWVHNVLTESFLAAYQAYGPRRLSTADADRFVAEQARIGALLGADPLPMRAVELREWVACHPEAEASAAQSRSLEFLLDPPLTAPVRVGYRLLSDAAIVTVPDRIRELSGLDTHARARQFGRRAVGALRWALGSSPSWHVALIRSGAEIPEGLFRQPLSREAREAQQRGVPAAPADRRLALAGAGQ